MNPQYTRPEYTREAYEKYYNMEPDWMAAEGYAESKEALLRKVAMRVILHSSKCDKLDAYIPYIAMNTFDRFISRHQLPIVLGKVRDDLDLTAHCCLMMAWKFTDIFSFSLEEFVKKRKLSRDNIDRVYLEIMMTETWHILAVPITPISFVGFFAAKIPVGRGVKRRSINEIIIQTQGDINFTRFRPSVIAASAILVGGRLLFDNLLYKINKMILLASSCVNKEELEACLTKTYEMCIGKKILLERNEGRELKVGAGETSSSSSHRPGKEPKQAGEYVKQDEVGACLTKTNLLERNEGRELKVGAGEASSSSSISRRPGKEPMLEKIKEEPEIDNEKSMLEEIKEEPKSNIAKLTLEDTIIPETNFELKWMLWSSDDPKEWTIDSPVFRAPTPAPEYNGHWGEDRCCFNLCPLQWR
ncbi:cyclin-D2-2 [Citrus sinensis]|uniref:Cyclin-D2-2 n=1 Tax=Citrus sinensis TaxID=2711 RepID=A0ACB8NY02_CITSI|nr:cyclin-D2-2 [Citrus sinensis]